MKANPAVNDTMVHGSVWGRSLPASSPGTVRSLQGQNGVDVKSRVDVKKDTTAALMLACCHGAMECIPQRLQYR